MRAKDNAYIIEAASDLPIMLVNGFLEGENIYSTVCDDHAAAVSYTHLDVYKRQYVGMCKVDFLVNLSGTADFIRLNFSISYDWDFFYSGFIQTAAPSESPLSNSIF